MCIDTGHGGTGENRECSKDVLFIGQLFIDTDKKSEHSNNR
jgi:hypothetical protein